MSDEEEREAAALERYDHVAETLRKRIGPPLSELDGAGELGELTNLMNTIQEGDPGESLSAIRSFGIGSNSRSTRGSGPPGQLASAGRR